MSTLTENLQSGSWQNLGYAKGIIAFETKPDALTEEDAKLLATWDALALLTQTNRAMVIPFDFSEPGESSAIEETLTDGSTIILGSTNATDTYRMLFSLSAMKTVYGQLKMGKDLYIYIWTSLGYIVGKEVTENTIEAVKYRLSSTESSAGAEIAQKVNVHMTAKDNTWKENATFVQPEPVFGIDDISSVKSMTFTATEDSLTSLTVSVKDLDKIGVTDLDTVGAGNFVLTNTTDSSTITITGITRTGYSYVLAFSAQTEADAYSLSYGEPDATSELWDLKTAITGTLNA